MKSAISMALAGATFVGCAVTTEMGPNTSDGKADIWNSANSPSRFDDPDMIYQLTSLPRTGEADRQAWRSYTWPASVDSINTRWAQLGSSTAPYDFSAAQKYDLVFNNWALPSGFRDLAPYRPSCNPHFDRLYYEQQGPLARYVTLHLGSGRAHDGIDSDGDEGVDECRDLDGVAFSNLSDGWASAAILEDTPLHTIIRDGVTFTPTDLQGLLAAAYRDAPYKIIGQQCQLGTPLAPNGVDDDLDGAIDEWLERSPRTTDEAHRLVGGECRDNAGAFHVALTNYLGLKRMNLIADVETTFGVDNEVIHSYRTETLRRLSAREANELLLAGSDVPVTDTYFFNSAAKQFQLVEVRLTMVGPVEELPLAEPRNQIPTSTRPYSLLSYVLELDEAGKIIGGEYIDWSKGHHPDFVWLPRRIDTSVNPLINLDQLRDLVREARQQP